MDKVALPSDQAVLAATPGKDHPEDNISLRELLVQMIHICQGQEEMESLLKEVHTRQSTIEELQKVLQTLHKKVDKNGKLEVKKDEEIINALKKAKELGVDLDLEKTTYTHDEFNRLTTSIKMPIDSLKTRNDLAFQKLTSLKDRQNEFFQLEKTSLDALDSAMKAFIKGMR